MGDFSKRVGGEPFHVGESHIWAMISYLDSPSDYRECISHAPSHFKRLAGSELVMLDCVKKSQGQGERFCWIVPAIMLMLAGTFLYLIHSW